MLSHKEVSDERDIAAGMEAIQVERTGEREEEKRR